MNNPATTRQTAPPGTAFFALFFLIFLQLLSDLIETTYVFGLLGVSIPPEVVSVLFLLAPLLLVFLPRSMESPTFAAVSAVIALLCRAAAVVVDTRWKMLLSGLGVGLMLIFFAAMFWQMRGRKAGHRMGLGLAFASLMWILHRVIGMGTDISTFRDNNSFVFPLVLFAGIELLGWQRFVQRTEPQTETDAVHPLTVPRAIALGIGVFSAPLLLYFGLSAPAVIARWTEANYVGITLLLAGSIVLWAVLWARNPRFRARLIRPRTLELWNGLFLIALAFLLRAFTINFPADSAAYPLAAAIPGPLAWLALLLVLVLHPVIFVDFALLAQALLDRAARPRPVAVAVFAGSLWLLLMSFAHVFTTVYDYIPVIGPLFRDNFWLVYAAAGLGLLLPLLFMRPAGLPETDPVIRPNQIALTGLSFFVICAVVVLLFDARPAPPTEEALTLRVLTYNIQQGYTEDGQKGFDMQLEVIRGLRPDIIGLQESDTARIAGGNADVVRYFADQLNYYSYYGPSTVTGTFGIALLSHYPIEDPQTFFMYSEGEQTAAILATIRAGDTPYTVLVTHLGNGGPMIQQQQVLQILEGRENVIAMGDFNFRPGSEQYALTTAQYEDAWEVAAKQELLFSDDLNPGRKIDHVFITPGLPVQRGVYIAPGPSDHPGLFVEIGK